MLPPAAGALRPPAWAAEPRREPRSRGGGRRGIRYVIYCHLPMNAAERRA